MQENQIFEFLEEKVELYNSLSFIDSDPISIPHKFTKKQDIEIIGFWTAILSWGQRKTILNKANELLDYMDNSPYNFILNHTAADLKSIVKFKHRTFNSTDTLYFIDFFKWYYSHYDTLEDAFLVKEEDDNKVENGIKKFHDLFISLPTFLPRTRKHIATPARKSSCKRINMFLRWMVRKDNCGVDFGIWNKINQKDLMIPLDVHVYRIAHKMGLLKREKTDWQAVKELTSVLKIFDPNDPVKYDFALFSLGVNQEDLF